MTYEKHENTVLLELPANLDKGIGIVGRLSATFY